MDVVLIREEVFKVTTRFLVNCTRDEGNCYLKKIYGVENAIPKDCDGTMLSFNLESKHRVEKAERVIWIDRFNPKNPEDLGVLGHEVFHLVVRICEWKQVPIVANHPNGDCGDETAAYLLDYYISEFLKGYGKRKQKKSC